MEFAIAYPAKTDAWKDVVIAEDNGFTQCWFYDSQMLYSDVYVTMALAAEHTNRIKLATGVAIPSNRIEPVTAHSIATINLLAPGRTILGVGTGFTGRNTMGLPPITADRLRDYVKMVRALLRGEEVQYQEGKRQRWIRLLHQDKGYINLKDQIPIHIAADGPKVLELAGEIGDGWMTVLSGAERFREKFAMVKTGLAKSGKNANSFPTAVLTSGCVLRDGEKADSPRVRERMGPFAIVFLHALWEQSAVASGLPDSLAGLWNRYRDEYIAKSKTPEDRRYLDVHEGHLIYLKPGEEKYIDENLIKTMTLTGTPGEIIARLKALEAEGLKQVSIQVVYPHGREMIEEFSRQIIAKY
jgi:alkanesulfonate monooxygenase SsuD/methylene tetrahydromethanopterin reductase-like flavin-dependent oxidoreductase (luciferase family)